jgi:hypothetical protein
MYIEAKESIEIDPDFTLLRLLKINELIPSFKSLTLNNEISLKIISKSKRNWRVIDDFIKTLRKFAEIKLSPKESAELTIIIYEGDTKFFEEKALKELPCIGIKNSIIYNKVKLSKFLFGIINCKDKEKNKMLIFAPTFQHLYLFSPQELTKRAWKSIWIWNKHRLIYTADVENN